MQFSEFKSMLRRDEFYRNYFLFGPDSYLIENAKEQLLNTIKEKGGGDLLQTNMDLEESSVDEVVNMARSLPLFAQKQMIAVKGVMKLREKQGKKLEEYFHNESPFTVMIFTAGSLDRSDKERKIFEILRRGTKVVELPPLTEEKVKEWIDSRCKRAGFLIDPDAIDFLLEWNGNDLWRLSNEIEKVCLYLGSDRSITLQKVEEAAGFSRGHSVDEFIKALAEKDEINALRLVPVILKDRDETNLKIWMLAQQLRQLLQIKEISAKMSAFEIGKQIGLNYYYAVYSRQEAPRKIKEKVEQLILQSKRFSKRSLVLAISRLGSLDNRIKGYSINPEFYMELLVHDLAR